MVRFAVRCEYARTVEDVLARRCRLLFLDARLAVRLAPRVAEILQEEGQNDPGLPGFLALTQQYLQLPACTYSEMTLYPMSASLLYLLYPHMRLTGASGLPVTGVFPVFFPLSRCC